MNPEPDLEPPIDSCPRCADLTIALREARRLLSVAANEGYNLDLDVKRWLRRNTVMDDIDA